MSPPWSEGWVRATSFLLEWGACVSFVWARSPPCTMGGFGCVLIHHPYWDVWSVFLPPCGWDRAVSRLWCVRESYILCACVRLSCGVRVFPLESVPPPGVRARPQCYGIPDPNDLKNCQKNIVESSEWSSLICWVDGRTPTSPSRAQCSPENTRNKLWLTRCKTRSCMHVRGQVGPTTWPTRSIIRMNPVAIQHKVLTINVFGPQTKNLKKSISKNSELSMVSQWTSTETLMVTREFVKWSNVKVHGRTSNRPWSNVEVHYSTRASRQMRLCPTRETSHDRTSLVAWSNVRGEGLWRTPKTCMIDRMVFGIRWVGLSFASAMVERNSRRRKRLGWRGRA